MITRQDSGSIGPPARSDSPKTTSDGANPQGAQAATRHRGPQAATQNGANLQGAQAATRHRGPQAATQNGADLQGAQAATRHRGPQAATHAGTTRSADGSLTRLDDSRGLVGSGPNRPPSRLHSTDVG